MTGPVIRRVRPRSGPRPPLQVLLVHAHPSTDGFAHAVADAAARGLTGGGHSVHRIDLYAERFAPALTLAERRGYDAGAGLLDDQVVTHADLVRWCDALVFVYPTWWSGLPAILKGWLDRVLVAGVAFDFHPRTGKVRPGLTRMRHLVGVSTYGSSRPYVKLVNDNGRRTLHRALWMSCSLRTRRTWLGLYGIDTSTAADRHAFLQRVEERMGRLDRPRWSRPRTHVPGAEVTP